MARSSQPASIFLPNWFRWLGAGLTAMLGVLFVVLLQQVRQQAQTIQTIESRLQGLENARAVERTSALEQQLRATSERLQGLERLRGSLESLGQEQNQLRQEVRRLANRAPLLPELPSTPAPLPGTLPAPATE